MRGFYPRCKRRTAAAAESGLLVALVWALVACAACTREIVPEPYRPSSDHDAYRHALVEAGLEHSALGRDWIAASRRSLDEALFVVTPFEEARYIDRTQAFAVAFGFDALRGRRLEIAVTFQGEEWARLFVDLFRVSGDSAAAWVPVASAGESDRRLEFEPRRDGRYVVRIQSELLRGGRCVVAVRQVAALGFPVEGRDERDIGSGFGAPRDGGRRTHQGVDIFAPRHTPVLAPARSRVRWVGENRLGGRCIWLYDEQRSLYYYLAHLESWQAEARTMVERGDIVGTVGNSGNARTTPPHLHFSIRVPDRGWEDPFPFVRPGEKEPPSISGDLGLLGQWGRAVSDLNSPGGVGVIQRGTPMRVVAAVDGRYRVQLPDGVLCSVPAQVVEPAAVPLEEHPVAALTAVRETPATDAVAVDRVAAGERVLVLGTFAGSWLVRTPRARLGWVVGTRR